jgi:hypothetical protein
MLCSLYFYRIRVLVACTRLRVSAVWVVFVTIHFAGLGVDELEGERVDVKGPKGMYDCQLNAMEVACENCQNESQFDLA